jgi:integrase
MEPWTVHDIRRSVATHMARMGVPQEHIERVLGHVVQGVAGTYNRYSYMDEKRAALEAWGKLWTA